MYIAVGPSAPPIIPIEAACLAVNCPDTFAKVNAKYIPNCAAAPKRRLIGFAINGPKSVIAPTPMNIRQGKRLLLTPLYIILRTPAEYQG